MSIASSATAVDVVEFYVRLVTAPASDNPLTPLLFEKGAGARVYVRMHAAGVFTIPETVGAGDQRLRVLVGAGTGAAPFVSMIRTAAQTTSASLRQWVLLHGARIPADLGYRAELDTYVAARGLRYWGSVSRPQLAPAWQGEVGRVEEFFAATRLAQLEQRLGLAPGDFVPSRAAVWICGLRGTIAGTLTALLARGFVPDTKRMREALGIPSAAPASLFYEQYDHEPVIDLKNDTLVAALRAVAAAGQAYAAERA